MSRGPLPAAEKRRRNAPTIPKTNLPVAGRKGRPPKVPGGYELGKAGRDWWKWAWTTPQALAWDKGAHYFIARRAALEDDLAAIDEVDEFELAELLGVDDENEAARKLGWVIGRLKSLAGGRTAIMREMRELDNRLGLNPKAMADLRWSITGEEDAAQQPTRRGRRRSSSSQRARLSVVK